MFTCDKGGKHRDLRDSDLHASRRRPNTASQKCNCPFRVVAKQNLDGTWEAAILEERGHHNHTSSDKPEAHAAHRNRGL